MNKHRVWLIIIGIVMVGVFVTRMTAGFVSSRGVDAAAIVGVTEEEKDALSAQNAAVNRAAGPSSGAGANMPRAASVGPAAVPAPAAAPEASLKQAAAPAAEQDVSGVPETAASKNLKPDAGEAAQDALNLPEEELVDVPETAEETDAAAGGLQREAGAAEDTAGPGAAPETIRSPLETAAAEKAAEYVEERDVSAYTSEELRVRLDAAREQVSKSRPSGKGPVSAYAQAEYEYNVWDKELNLIYSCVRCRMTEKEAEELKYEEVAWLKERDMAADKASVKNNMAPGQNEQYARTLAEKTKERCYELLDDYGDVIDGE